MLQFLYVFSVSLLIVYKVLFHLLTACSTVSVSRCRVVIPKTNFRVCGSFPLCLVLTTISACRRVSDLLVILSRVVCLIVSCFLFVFIFGTFLVLGRIYFLPLPPISCQDRLSSLSSLSVLSILLRNLLFGLVLRLLLLIGMCGYCNLVVEVVWVFDIYIYI
jgi:hypothetical protein